MLFQVRARQVNNFPTARPHQGGWCMPERQPMQPKVSTGDMQLLATACIGHVLASSADLPVATQRRSSCSLSSHKHQGVYLQFPAFTEAQLSLFELQRKNSSMQSCLAGIRMTLCSAPGEWSIRPVPKKSS